MTATRLAVSPARAFSPAVLAVYSGALFQGLALVSFPALSAVLTRGYALTDAQYGAIFLPQVGSAVLGAVLGGSLARRIGLKTILVLSLLAALLSQALLAALAVLPEAWAFACVLTGTAALGLGFGLSGAPINSYPPTFFPRAPHGAVVAAHTLVGLGLAAGPLLAGEMVAHDVWWGFPLLLVGVGAALTVTVLTVSLPRDEPAGTATGGPTRNRPLGAPAFWTFAGIIVLYALAEGTFSSWAVIFLRDDRGVPEMSASLALSSFWGAVVAGRLVISALVARVAPTIVWAALPVLMIVAFLALPYASDGASGVALFALAGFSCSAFLPLTITLASQRFPDHVAWVASMLIAALMVGVGVGSFAVGALRDMLVFDDLYRLSALYPAAVLLLAIPVLRHTRHLS